MKNHQMFNEVMIVNPSDPRLGLNQGVRLMPSYYPPMGYYGYYAEPPDQYGYFAEAPPGAELYGMGDPYGYYGYYAEAPEMVGWGDPYGYYGYYGEDYPMAEAYEPMGWYGEAPPGQEIYGYGEPMSPPGSEIYGYGEPMPPSGSEIYGYGESMPPSGSEIYGYGETMPPGSEIYGYNEYPDPSMSGYVRETRPTFNARCGCPTNVRGLGEDPRLEGYVKPSTVNASCGQFTPQPGSPASEPDTFKPLW